MITTPFQRNMSSEVKKKVISKIRWEKGENFTLNPYILDNFAYNMEFLYDRYNCKRF